MPGYTRGFTRGHRLTAEVLGLDAQTLDAARTSNSFSIAGYNQMKVRVARTNNSGTATSFYIETSEDGGTTWDRQQSGSVSSGTETLSSHVVSAAAATANYFYYIPVYSADGDIGRLVFASNSDAADIISCSITLGVSA